MESFTFANKRDENDSVTCSAAHSHIDVGVPTQCHCMLCSAPGDVLENTGDTDRQPAQARDHLRAPPLLRTPTLTVRRYNHSFPGMLHANIKYLGLLLYMLACWQYLELP